MDVGSIPLHNEDELKKWVSSKSRDELESLLVCSLRVHSESTSSTENLQARFLSLERGDNASSGAPTVPAYHQLMSSENLLDFEPDCPDMRSKVLEAEKSIDEVNSHMAGLALTCQRYCGKGMSHVNFGKQFFRMWQALGDDHWTERLGAVAPLIAQVGASLEELEEVHEGMLSALENAFSGHLNSFLKKEVSTLYKLKQEHSIASDEFEAAMEKHLAEVPKTESDMQQMGAGATLAADVASKRIKHELARFDLIEELDLQTIKKRMQLCDRISSAVYGFLGYHKACHASLAVLESGIAALSGAMTRARELVGKERLLRDGKRNQLERDLRKTDGLMQASRAVQIWRDGDATKEEPQRYRTTRRSIIRSFNDHPVATKKIAGFLWKRSTKQEWQRRWFFVRDGRLYYTREPSHASAVAQQVKCTGSASIFTGVFGGQAAACQRTEGGEEEEVMTVNGGGNVGTEEVLVADLKISTVKTSSDRPMGSDKGNGDGVGVGAGRRFTFEIISPTLRNYSLQAESEDDCRAWIAILRQEIEQSLYSALAMTSSTGTATATATHGSVGTNEVDCRVLRTESAESEALDASALTEEQERQLREVPGNRACADCNALAPAWAVVNRGILVCIDCSGVHRSLGSHLSKVRSLHLDLWTPSLLQLMYLTGNGTSNSVFTRGKSTREDEGAASQMPSMSGGWRPETRQRHIMAKYVEDATVALTPSATAKEELVLSLYTAAQSGDLPGILRALAAGAEVNAREKGTGQTALHAATLGGHAVSVELLCQNGARVDLRSRDENKSSLDYATKLGQDEIIDILVSQLHQDVVLESS